MALSVLSLGLLANQFARLGIAGGAVLFLGFIPFTYVYLLDVQERSFVMERIRSWNRGLRRHLK